MLILAKEIINKSLELFKRDFRIWISYMLVSFFSALLGLLFAFNPTVLLFFATLGVSPFVVLMISSLLLLALAVFNIWFNISLVRTIHKRLFNTTALPIWQQMLEVKHLLPRTIALSLLLSIIIFLPFVLSVVGLTITGFQNFVLGNIQNAFALYLFFGLLALYGVAHFIHFSVKYVFSYYLVTLEEKKVRQSLHEGQKLVANKMLPIFWRLAFPLATFLFVYFLIDYILQALANFVAISFVSYIADILSLSVSAVVAMLSVIATVILYEDVKAKMSDTSVKKV